MGGGGERQCGWKRVRWRGGPRRRWKVTQRPWSPLLIKSVWGALRNVGNPTPDQLAYNMVGWDSQINVSVFSKDPQGGFSRVAGVDPLG